MNFHLLCFLSISFRGIIAGCFRRAGRVENLERIVEQIKMVAGAI